MTLKKPASPLCATLFVLLAMSTVAADKKQDEPYVLIDESPGVSTSTRAFLDDARRALLERRGLDGSAEDAYRVFLHYETRIEPERDTKVALFWAKIAAENGHAGAQYILARMLSADALQDRDGRTLRRACYWLKRASTGGIRKLDGEMESMGCRALWAADKR